MSLTAAVHKRFWSAMGERFGKRWLDEYGKEPTASWKDLLDKYSQEDILGAMTLMGGKGWQYPPTMPQFESLLIDAAKSNRKDPVDWVRGYWRSEIASHLARNAFTRGWIKELNDFELFIVFHKATLGPPARDILDEVDSMEKATQQRTSGMHEHVRQRCAKLFRTWSPYPVERLAAVAP